MLDPVPIMVIRFCMAVLFAAAAVSKLTDVRTFQAVVAGYELLPPAYVGRVARALPLLEAGFAAGWLVSVSLPLLAAASAGLLFVYAAAIAANLLRGRRDVRCGCSFGGGDGISWWQVTRNLVLAGAALTAALPASGRLPGVADYALAATAAVAVTVLYLCVQQLIGNAIALSVWRDREEF